MAVHSDGATEYLKGLFSVTQFGAKMENMKLFKDLKLMRLNRRKSIKPQKNYLMKNRLSNIY